MNSKRIHQLASLVMALVMILGNTLSTQAATPAAQAAGPSIYWGAMVEGKAPSTATLEGVMSTFETRSKKKMSIIHWGQPWVLSNGSWGEFQTAHFENTRNHGSIPMINWASWRLGSGTNQPDFQLRDIYEGKYDAYITRWATAAKNWGHPFFLRFNHESNGWWYPWGEGRTDAGEIVNGNSTGDFIKAWRHVHDIFTAVGATNVTWVWSMNNMGQTSQYPALSTLYPGDAYVDWTGLTAYNKYRTWTGLKPLLIGGEGGTWLKDSYNELVAVAPNKPMMLVEFGSIEAGDGGAKKAAWITDALTKQIPINFPQLKAVVWMNWDINAGRTYPIESSQAATDAWAVGIGSAVYATNQYANLNTSPIPPLTASPIVPSATPVVATPTTAVTPTAAPPTGGTASLIAVADTYIDNTNPASTAGGTSTTLYVDASPVKKTFLKFDLTSLAGKTISAVKLRIKTTSHTSAGSASSSAVKVVSDTQWKELYMSFNNTVPISATVLGTMPANSVPNTWYEIPLTSSAIQPSAGGLLSMAIETASSDGLGISSREAADKPQLVVTYK